MNGQVHAGDATPIQGQANGYHQDTQGYAHHAGPNGKDVNGHALAHAFGGLAVHASHTDKYPPKGNMATAPNGANANGGQRPPYVFVPSNGAMMGAMPTPPAFGQAPPHHAHDQGTPLHYFPSNFYPGFVANTPLVPGPAPGYPWPYLFNNEVHDYASFHRDSWNMVDENTPGNFDVNAQSGYYPSAAAQPPTPTGYVYNGPPGQVSHQWMRTPTGGYAFQDLDAILKQEPAIPHAVPAMWTNPGEMTLAKCLENREGITNVYVRGFLPETTDEILHSYAARFGKIERCKAIIDLDTGLCKGLVLPFSL